MSFSTAILTVASPYERNNVSAFGNEHEKLRHLHSLCRRRGRYVHNIQQTQETSIHALSMIRTRNSSTRAAARPPRPAGDLFKIHDKNAATYKFTKCVVWYLENYIPLPFAFNAKIYLSSMI